MLSDKRKQEILKVINEGAEINSYLKTINFEGVPKWYLGKLNLLTYMSTENLISHSKTLTWLTIGLFVTALAMIGLAILQLVVLLRTVS